MGTDNQHHKRKAKSERAHQRKIAQKQPYDRVLIVCEGGKTEPNYFQELCDHYQLSTANVKIDGKCGSSPKSVYEHALKLFKQSEKEGNAYDRVYCVFDKDSHPSYKLTVDVINKQDPENTFFAITSVPCFEYWLLLHFEVTFKPYAPNGKLSIAGMVEKDLKKHLPNYQKAERGLFRKLLAQLEDAKRQAEQSMQFAINQGSDNPSTRVHQLVAYLQKVKSNPHK